MKSPLTLHKILPLIQGALVAFIILHLSLFIFIHQKYFTTPFDHIKMGNLYANSQYVIGELSKGGIGDDGVYSYAGYYYLFQGGDVSKINFEHPPLGKYLIGVSILVFHNENVINLIYFAGILFVSYLLSQRVLKNRTASLLVVALLAADPLLNDHLIRSLLDLPFMFFFLLATYFFIKRSEQKYALLISQFFWACCFSTKFFPAFLFVYIVLFGYVFLFERKLLKQFLLSSLIIPLVYLLTHASYFYYTPSLIEFVRFRKWTIAWWGSSPIVMGNTFRNIFSGSYINSTGDVVQNEFWNVGIPLIVVFTTARMIQVIQKLLSYSLSERSESKGFDYAQPIISELLFVALIACYFFYTNFFTGGLLKFLFPVWPLMLIESIYLVQNQIKSLQKQLRIYEYPK